MEAKMNMQSMAMDDVHNTFWRDDQVCILFLTDIPLLNEAGILNREPLRNLMFELPNNVTRFLNQVVGGAPAIQVQLNFLNGGSHPDSKVATQTKQASHRTDSEDDPGIFPGVYPFEVALPPIDLPLPFTVHTSIAGFFQIEVPSQPSSGTPLMRASASSGHNSPDSLVVSIVEKINKKENLEELNRELSQESGGHIVATVAAPVWLSGGTGDGITQGCPLTPPMPVSDSCSNWHIELPDLSPDLQSKTGEGVTVFILDSFPERGVIERAARDAGDDNLLLREVNETVEFDYNFMSGIKNVQEMGDTQGTFVGKDVYGRHYPILLADHGLFIAGIVHDVAPEASIECIRVLNDLCVGDVQLISKALWNIYLRKVSPASMPQAAPLDGKPVVINMSLVIPTDEELKSKNVDPTSGALQDIRANLFYLIKALTELEVIVVASAGNEADLREMSGGNRPDALRPAAWGNEPYQLEGIVPVGAVNGSGKATSYSCYPGNRGIATYGGEVPKVPLPTSNNPSVDTSDMLRGIYSSVEYPPLSADPPEQYYTAPDDHAWAYWVGTSFATPIISGLAARILEKKKTTPILGSVRDNVLRAASGSTAWDRLSSSPGGAATGAGGDITITQTGRVIRAMQQCWSIDRDDEGDEDEAQVEIEITEIKVTINESNG